jgi:hypothetical protein
LLRSRCFRFQTVNIYEHLFIYTDAPCDSSDRLVAMPPRLLCPRSGKWREVSIRMAYGFIVP